MPFWTLKLLCGEYTDNRAIMWGNPPWWRHDADRLYTPHTCKSPNFQICLILFSYHCPHLLSKFHYATKLSWHNNTTPSTKLVCQCERVSSRQLTQSNSKMCLRFSFNGMMWITSLQTEWNVRTVHSWSAACWWHCYNLWGIRNRI